MSVADDRIAPLAAARAHGYGLSLCAAPPPGEPGWRPATATAALPERLERATAAAGAPSRAVAATWILEKHAWHACGAAVAGLLVHDAMPPLDGLWLRDGEHGWPEAVAVPPGGWRRASGVVLAARLEAHLLPLVDALAPYRARRPLWRSAADRLGQAALWCGEAFGDRPRAWALAADALTALGAPAELAMRDGAPFRRRCGCCLAHRCPAGLRCEDCPVSGR